MYYLYIFDVGTDIKITFGYLPIMYFKGKADDGD